jgi:hypothetical protein
MPPCEVSGTTEPMPFLKKENLKLSASVSIGHGFIL